MSNTNSITITATFLALLLLLLGCTIPSPPRQVVNETQTTPNTTTVVQENSTPVVDTTPKIFETSTFLPRKGNVTYYFFNQPTDFIIVTTPNNKAILINAGTNADAIGNVRFMKNIGVETLSKLIITSNEPTDNDGAAYISFKFKPEDTIATGMLRIDGVLNVSELGFDTTTVIDDVIVTLVVPYDDGLGFSPVAEQNTILVKTKYKSTSFLYGSKCVDECEDRTTNSDLSANTFYLANNGACNSTTTSFLQRVDPSVVIYRGAICPEVKARLDYYHVDTWNIADYNLVFMTTDGVQTSWGVMR